MSKQVVIETPTGWMINCPCAKCGWHEFPKKGRPGASWTFNGDLIRPTFTPSMNQCLNPYGKDHNPDAHLHDFRCHFIVTDGRMSFCGDCSHELKNTVCDMIPFDDVKVAYYASVMADHKAKEANEQRG